MIVVAGGTGALGSAIARSLLDSRRPVRVITRDTQRAEKLRAAGATHIITTANAFTGRGDESVAAVDLQGTRNLIDVAKEMGVRQFIFTSARLPRAYAAVDYFAVKFANEDYLRASGVPYTILKPTAFMETWAHMIAESVLHRGTVDIFGSGRVPANFVAVHDVAQVAGMTIDRPDAMNAEVKIGGPENLTLLQVADTIERVTGRTARRRHVPVWMMRVLPPLLRPFNAVLARSIKAGALMATIPQPFDPAPMLARFPVTLTRLEDWARARYAARV